MLKIIIFYIIYILSGRIAVIMAKIDYKKMYPYSRSYTLLLTKEDAEKISKLQLQIEDRNREILLKIEKSKRQLDLIKDDIRKE